MKAVIKKLLPPILLDLVKKKPAYGYLGDYATWQEAQAHSDGYDHPAILEKVKTSLLKVKNGQAVYERDSVLFDKIEYSWALLAALLRSGIENNGKLDVLDFGGSLGSSYFQNRGFLQKLSHLSWNIVEQPDFVACGKQYFQDDKLKFHKDIDECLRNTKIDIFLALSVIQYLEKPYEFLENILKYDFPYLVFDRTTFLPDRERIAVQKVRPGIYDASYPVRFIDERKFLAILGKKYSVVADFDSLGGTKGYILKLKA